MASAVFKVGFGASYYMSDESSSAMTLVLISFPSSLALCPNYQTHLEMAVHDNLPILLKDSEHFSAFCKIPWSRENLDMDSAIWPISCRSSDCRSSSRSGHDAWRCDEQRKVFVDCGVFKLSG